MTTRLYFKWTDSGFTAALSSDWENYSATRADYALSLVESTSSPSDIYVEPYAELTGNLNDDYLIVQAISESLAAQLISGTVKGVLYGYEEAAAHDLCPAISIRVVTSAGAARGTLYENFPSATTHEFDDSAEQTRYFPEENLVTPITCQAGDRLVVEVGFRALSTAGRAGSYGYLIVGQDPAASDVAYGETTYYSGENPWIEFSDNLLFGSGGGTSLENITRNTPSHEFTKFVWGDSLTRLRRYLRDINGQIWSDAELLQYFNDAALEIAFKTGALVRVETYNFPPEYEYSYTHDWEIDYTNGTTHQALTINQVSGDAICHPWETAYWLDTEPTAADGYVCTHPWEMAMYSPHDVIPIPLHSKFHKGLIACYDESPIDPIDESTLADQDGYYRTREGDPTNYWRIDENQNRIVLYPRPSPVWDDTQIYEVLDDTGGMNLTESWQTPRDTGITTDIISTENTLLMVYTAMPVDLESHEDEIDFPRYMVKYIEYAALERAYGADTEGYIPSLRDYWGLRKKVGLEALKVWKRLSMTNRTFRLGGGISKFRDRHPRLPSTYPRN